MLPVIDWAKVLIGVIDLLIKVTNIFEQKMLIDLGQKQAIANYLQKQADDFTKAQASREAIRIALERDPSLILRQDKFTRSDSAGSP